MPIYDKPVRALIKDMVDEFGLQNGQTFDRQQAIDWFAKKYNKIKKATITSHLVRLSVNVPSRLHHTVKPGEDDIFFKIDSSRFRLYNPLNDPLPIHPSSSDENGSYPEEEINKNENKTSTEFAYESDLRDYLAKNLNTIELGLKLYKDEEITGIEFSAGGRFIDILAVDSKGDFVVIELKVSRGYDRVIGQTLSYMGWIQKNLADSQQKTRGIIIAREISESLILACSLIPNIKILEYHLSLTLNPVCPVRENSNSLIEK